MPIVYPRTDIMSLVRFGPGTSWSLEPLQEISQTAGGQSIVLNLADPLWVADFVTSPRMGLRAELPRLQAALNSLILGGYLFEAWDPRPGPFPAAYPSGDFTDAAAIATLPTDASTISLSGLPAAFQITQGDYFAFRYGAGNRFRALHQAAEDVLADGSGVTVAFSVVPRIRPGALVGSPVRFKRTTSIIRGCWMQIVPGTLQAPSGSSIEGQVRFRARQVHEAPAT